MELGYMDYDEPTEKYGSVTKEAVEVFQRRHGLTVDGYIGEETYDRFDARGRAAVHGNGWRRGHGHRGITEAPC